MKCWAKDIQLVFGEKTEVDAYVESGQASPDSIDWHRLQAAFLFDFSLLQKENKPPVLELCFYGNGVSSNLDLLNIVSKNAAHRGFKVSILPQLNDYMRVKPFTSQRLQSQLLRYNVMQYTC